MDKNQKYKIKINSILLDKLNNKTKDDKAK